MGYLNDNADITAPIASYWPNKYGVYNMSGNIAEMLTVKETVKGGSWLDAEYFLKIDNKREWDGKSQPYIGFRYFVEVIKKEIK